MNFDYYQRNFLEKRIDFRMKHLNVEDYQDYINLIHSSPVERNLFLDKFTINYTYFFRNSSVFQNFEKFINLYINNLKDRKRMIKIWSAPCATGDEPYSLAMLLDHLTKKNKNFPDFKIYASDIDTNAIKVASEGIYGEYAVHDLPEHYLTTYFSKRITELGPTFSINSHIRKKVEFIQEDIIKGHHWNYKYDVIFCRNFFIYINQNARDNILKIIENRLYERGLLVLGGSETIHRKNNKVFKPISLRDRFYIKSYSNKNSSYENEIYNVFNTKRIRRTKTPISDGKKSFIKKERIDKPRRIPKHFKKPKEKFKEEKSQINVPVIQEKEAAEVRITQMVVNNGSNRPLNKSKKNKISKSLKFPVEGEKNSSIDTREKALKRRELILQQKEQKIEEKIRYIEEERKKTNELLKNVKEKETEVLNRMLLLERTTRQVEQREKIIKQRETQLEKRLNQIEQYSRQIIEQERQLSRYSNENEEEKKEEVSSDSFEARDIDRIKNPNDRNELNIPKGYYSLINSFDKNERSTKMTINGLGAGIALILKDPINNIFAMSHISLPSSGASKQGYHLLFPHTFADTSVKELYNSLIYNGGNISNIKALIVGGAKLFLDYDMTYQENVDSVKKELMLNQIEIEAEDLGGLSERSVIYDTINDSLFVKKTWEFEFRKIA